MTTPFLACAAITAISACVSLGYSVAAARNAVGEARTLGFYACARSVALAVVSFVPFLLGSQPWLAAAAVSMIVVQAGDALVGARLGDRVKTYGPAATAVLNLSALLWLLGQPTL